MGKLQIYTPEEVRAMQLAAPQLLAAAKRAFAVLKAQGHAVEPKNVLGALDAAIKKATPAANMESRS